MLCMTALRDCPSFICFPLLFFSRICIIPLLFLAIRQPIQHFSSVPRISIFATLSRASEMILTTVFPIIFYEVGFFLPCFYQLVEIHDFLHASSLCATCCRGLSYLPLEPKASARSFSCCGVTPCSSLCDRHDAVCVTNCHPCSVLPIFFFGSETFCPAVPLCSHAITISFCSCVRLKTLRLQRAKNCVDTRWNCAHTQDSQLEEQFFVRCFFFKYS